MMGYPLKEQERGAETNSTEKFIFAEGEFFGAISQRYFEVVVFVLSFPPRAENS